MWVLGFMCLHSMSALAGLVNIQTYRGKHPLCCFTPLWQTSLWLNIDILIEKKSSSTDFPDTLFHCVTTSCLHAAALIT